MKKAKTVLSFHEISQYVNLGMKYIILSLFLTLPSLVVAGAWTRTALVEDIEIIRGQGFQITGSFGNPSGCTNADAVFVSETHPQYDQLLSVAVSAFMGGKKLRIYSHQCINYGWHGGTFNELTNAGAMYLKKIGKRGQIYISK